MNSQCIKRVKTEDGWIEVWKENQRISLYYDDEILQSEIDLSQPAELPNPANRAMLAPLMFGMVPRSILLAGCGGGAIARWFHHRSPVSKGTAVEISHQVTEVAKTYFEFPKISDGWQLEVADIRDYLDYRGNAFDFILVDIAENGRTPEWAIDKGFLEKIYRNLTTEGVLTINLVGEDEVSFTKALFNIRQVFRQKTLCLSVPGHENIMTFAFKQAPDLSGIDKRLKALSEKWGLEFDEFWHRMRAENPSGSGIL